MGCRESGIGRVGVCVCQKCRSCLGCRAGWLVGGALLWIVWIRAQDSSVQLHSRTRVQSSSGQGVRRAVHGRVGTSGIGSPSRASPPGWQCQPSSSGRVGERESGECGSERSGQQLRQWAVGMGVGKAAVGLAVGSRGGLLRRVEVRFRGKLVGSKGESWPNTPKHRPNGAAMTLCLPGGRESPRCESKSPQFPFSASSRRNHDFETPDSTQQEGRQSAVFCHVGCPARGFQTSETSKPRSYSQIRACTLELWAMGMQRAVHAEWSSPVWNEWDL